MSEKTSDLYKKIKIDIGERVDSIEESRLEIFKELENVIRERVKKGKLIVEEGSRFEHIFFVARGFIEVCREVNQKKLFMKILIPGDFMGFGMVCNYDNYPYSLVALENSVLYKIPRYSITDDLLNDPRFYKWVSTCLIENMFEAFNRNNSLMTKNMYGRVAETLLKFSDEIFKQDVFRLPISKKQLGEYTNVSPENVSRIMKSFSNDKIIDVKGKNINILNKNGLYQILK